MRRIVWIPPIGRKHDLAYLVDSLIQIYPDEVVHWPAGDAWGMKLPENDPRAQASLNYLERAGLCPWLRSGPRIKGQEFSMEIHREYDDADLEPCRLLQLSPVEAASIAHPRYEGLVRVELFDDINGGDWDSDAAPIQAIANSWTIVSDRVKRLIAASDLRGITCRPTWCVPKKCKGKVNDDTAFPWDGFGEPWWEMTTDLILPPMSPSAILIGKDRNRITDRSLYHLAQVQREAVGTIDALVEPVEPRYLKSEIENMGEFDFARTHETFGHTTPDGGRKPIVSQRFYRFCRDNDIKCNFVPVRLD